MKKSRSPSLATGAEYLISLSLGYQVSQVLFAAVKLELFTILDDGEKNIHELAQIARSDKASLAKLVQVLIALNLLEKRNGLLMNSPVASSNLVKGKNGYLGNAIHHSSNLWNFWQDLDRQIKCGKAKKPLKKHLKNYSHRLKDYVAAMNDFGELKAPAVADAIAIDNFKKLLDVGCGRGTYALYFADRNTSLHCTIIDLKPCLKYTRKAVAKSSCQSRISISACNILKDEIPGNGYDLTFISNLIHIYAKNKVEELLKKTWDVTACPGSLVIHDYLLDGSTHELLPASLFDLTMFVGTPKGRCYTAPEIREMLKELGAKNIRQVPIPLGSSLLISEKRY